MAQSLRDQLVAAGLASSSQAKKAEKQKRAEAQARAQGKTFARLGELAEVLGNLDLAAERLSKATELFPDHYEAWHRLAAIERRRGNQDAAVQAAKQEAAARDRVGRPQGFPE